METTHLFSSEIIVMNWMLLSEGIYEEKKSNESHLVIHCEECSDLLRANRISNQIALNETQLLMLF